MLVWNAQLEKNLSRKLESRWSEPHHLVKINPGGVSGQVCKLYSDDTKQQRMHLDDMKVYCPRSDHPELVVSHTSVTHTHDIMKYARFPRQRVLELTWRL